MAKNPQLFVFYHRCFEVTLVCCHSANKKKILRWNFHTTVYYPYRTLLFYYYLSKRNEMKKKEHIAEERGKKMPVEHRLALKGN